MRSQPNLPTDMAMLVTDADRRSPKVWQPWYIDENDGVRKELPTRSQREQRVRERMALQRPTHRRQPGSASPYESSDEEIDVGVGVPPLIHEGTYSYSYVVNSVDDDAPLDMSIKRRSPPPAHTPTPPPAHTPTHSLTPPPSYRLSSTLQPPPPAHTQTSASPPPYHSRLTYPLSVSRGRPSVITCATGGYQPPSPFSPSTHEPPSGPERQYINVAHSPPVYSDRFVPPPPYSVAAAHLREQRRGNTKSEAKFSPTPEGEKKSPERATDELYPAKRQVVQAGPVDPEIDEHFRRSLGRNYHELFVTESGPDHRPESSDSVDDHFAKALGETWTKLKAKGVADRGSDIALPSTSPSFAKRINLSSSSPSGTQISTTVTSTSLSLTRFPPSSKLLSSSSEAAIPKGTNDVSITRIPTTTVVTTNSKLYPDVPLSLTAKVTPT